MVYCWKCGAEVSRRFGGKLYKHKVPGTSDICAASGTKPRNCREVLSVTRPEYQYNPEVHTWRWVNTDGQIIGRTLTVEALQAANDAMEQMRAGRDETVEYWERWASRRSLGHLRISVRNFSDDVTMETASTYQRAITQELLRREGLLRE